MTSYLQTCYSNIMTLSILKFPARCSPNKPLQTSLLKHKKSLFSVFCLFSGGRTRWNRRTPSRPTSSTLWTPRTWCWRLSNAIGIIQHENLAPLRSNRKIRTLPTEPKICVVPYAILLNIDRLWMMGQWGLTVEVLWLFKNLQPPSTHLFVLAHSPQRWPDICLSPWLFLDPRSHRGHHEQGTKPPFFYANTAMFIHSGVCRSFTVFMHGACCPGWLIVCLLWIRLRHSIE